MEEIIFWFVVNSIELLGGGGYGGLLSFWGWNFVNCGGSYKHNKPHPVTGLAAMVAERLSNIRRKYQPYVQDFEQHVVNSIHTELSAVRDRYCIYWDGRIETTEPYIQKHEE